MEFYLKEALKNKTQKYSAADQELILRSFAFSCEAHSHQKRQSGEEYIVHPVAVACCLADMQLDAASIVAGLLHDTVEDTDVTVENIKKKFGTEIAYLVQGLTKLKKIEISSDQTKQAENLRKLVLAMSEDIRVLLIKLVDRLHNMQTLYHVKSSKRRRRIALETMEIYAPLAERIGMKNLQDDLEDLAFAELYPDAYESIRLRLDTLEREGIGQIEQIVQKLKDTLKDADLSAQVSGRLKTPYSIWRKMKKKNISFEQISDVIAFRILVASIADCYQALGAIHNAYTVVPGTLKDYVSMPKPNHYQSLHTCIYFENKRIEIQIRTQEMHMVAEYGVAAHWDYKQNTEATEGRQYRWLRSLLEILESAHTADEFLEHTKLEMFQDQVFCFTPQGDLITLPKKATCIDFAYAVHSQIGNRCVGAKINGKMMPLRTELKNGDQVDIITSPTHEPSPTWERFVVTGKARAGIRRYIRTKQHSEFKDLGLEILKKACQQHHIPFLPKDFSLHLSKFKSDTLEDLYSGVGSGSFTAMDVLRVVFADKFAVPMLTEITADEITRSVKRPKSSQKEEKNESAVAIRGLIPGMAVHYAACCHPLPGDRIAGVVVTGKGVSVHTWDCDNLKYYEKHPERLLDITWDETEEDTYVGRIFVVLKNKPGALGTLSSIIGNANGNIVNLKITKRMYDFFDLYLDISVHDVNHLQTIIAHLRACPLVGCVERK